MDSWKAWGVCTYDTDLISSHSRIRPRRAIRIVCIITHLDNLEIAFKIGISMAVYKLTRIGW